MEVILLATLLLFSLGTLAQDDTGCPATGTLPYDYDQALCMSFLFYEAQRSGYLPADNRIPWRGDSAIDDGSEAGVDLEGGYYDAGDHVKFGFPFSFAITALAWGLIEHEAGYEAAGQTEYGRAAIKWGTDYMLKCHGGEMQLFAQVGDGDIDHAYWGRPEDMDMVRPVLGIDREAPGSDLAGETAAALAAASMVFEQVDPSYSLILLDYAREMFDFADQYRDTYTNSISNGHYYDSFSGYEDELGWAACWMYKATGEQAFMDKAEEYYDEFDMGNKTIVTFNWDDKTAGVITLLAEMNSDPRYMENLESFLEILTDSETTPYTDGGLLFVQYWGSIGESQGVAFIALRAAALGIETEKYEAWARNQLDYALGSIGHSYVVGFGIDPPAQCHHRAASCEDPPAPCDFSDLSKPEDNPHVLFGAVVGGPDDINDHWQDNRSNYVVNEVALVDNAAYSGVLARTIELNF